MRSWPNKCYWNIIRYVRPENIHYLKMNRQSEIALNLCTETGIGWSQWVGGGEILWVQVEYTSHAILTSMHSWPQMGKFIFCGLRWHYVGSLVPRFPCPSPTRQSWWFDLNFLSLTPFSSGAWAMKSHSAQLKVTMLLKCKINFIGWFVSLLKEGCHLSSRLMNSKDQEVCRSFHWWLILWWLGNVADYFKVRLHDK